MSSPIDTIFAGAEMLAKLTDGTSVRVRVRQMPARHLIEKVMPVLAVAHQCVEVCCTSVPGGAQLPENWVDMLEDDSLMELWRKARELNFSRAVRLADESLEVATQLLPLAQKRNALPS